MYVEFIDSIVAALMQVPWLATFIFIKGFFFPLPYHEGEMVEGKEFKDILTRSPR